MKNFLKTIVRRPVTICMLIIILLIAGVFATSNMTVNLLPSMNMPFVGINIIYPGASAAVIEEDVTLKLEEQLKSINGIESVSTYSMDNASVAVLDFSFGTDMSKKLDEIQSKLDTMALPSGCLDPTLTTINFNGEAVASISLYRQDNDLKKILLDANELQRLIYSVEGVGNVKLIGAPDEKISITSLNGLEISSLLIIEALSSSGLNIPLGTIMSDGQAVSIRNVDEVQSVEDIKRLPIKLDLPTSITNVARQFNSFLTVFETITLGEYTKYLLAASEMRSTIARIDKLSVEQTVELAQQLPMLKELVTLVSTNTADELVSLKNEVLNDVAATINYKSTAEEIASAALKHNLSLPLVQLVALLNQQTAATQIFDIQWNHIVNFRTVFSGNVTAANLAILLLDQQEIVNGKVVSGLSFFQQTLMSKKEVENIVMLTALDLQAFANLAVLKQEGKAIPDAIYAKLFNNEYINEWMIGFVRRSSYDNDIKVLSTMKNKYVDEHGNPIDQYGNSVTQSTKMIMKNSDALLLIEQLGLVDDAELRITEDMVNFMRTVNFETGTENGDSLSLILPLEAISHISVVDNFDSYSKYGEYKSIALEVQTVDGANTSKVVEDVKQIISSNEFESKTLLLEDRSKFINDSIDNIVLSIIIGGVLAILVIFLFTFKVRSSLVISITMPLSVLVALLCMWVIGISLNMVSLGGLAVGIGMLVDNSIVVLESITKRRDNGGEVFDSCVNGTKEVASSLFASTLTNICVFFPILFIQGMTKEIFTDLVYSIIFSISFSLIIAIIVIPTLYYLLYKNSKHKNKEEQASTLVIKAEKKYMKLITVLLRHKLLVCGIGLLVFVASIGLVFTTGTEFLPSIDQQTIDVKLSFNASSTAEEAANYTYEFYEQIKSIEEIDEAEFVSIKVGKETILSTSISGTLRIKLDEAANTSNVATLLRINAKRFPNAESISVTEIDGVVAEITSGFSNISCLIRGEDYEKLNQISEEVIAELLKSKYITNAFDDITEDMVEYRYTIDRNKCLEYGVDYSQVVSLMRVGLSGYDISNITFDNSEVAINVAFSSDSKQSIEAIENTIVGLSGSTAIKLSDVLANEAEAVNTKVLIRKVNGDYQVTINLEAEGADTGTISKEIKKIANKVLEKYPDYVFVESGVSSYLTDAFSGLVIALIIAFFLLYAVMACQFESLIKPLIVIVSIPFSFTGGFLAIFITNTTLNVVSFIGLIMLMGVIVNNAIIMIDKIDMLIKEGKEVKEAVLIGSSSRLRAIFMTTLTTILALVPLSLGLGSGGELMQPMGIVVFGGLLLGTLVTLVLIPCFYCIVKKISFKSKDA